MRKEKCTTLYLMGGFGNVLFQLNYAYNVASVGFKVKINTSLIDPSSKFLALFGRSIHTSLDLIRLLKLIEPFEVSNSISFCLIFAYLSKKIGITFPLARYYGHDSPKPSSLYKGAVLGYFHIGNEPNEVFIKLLRRNIFSTVSPCLKDGNLKYVMKQIDGAQVVHLRGGDYKNTIQMLPEEFYTRAINKDLKIIVVTDDPEYAKLIFSCYSSENIFVVSSEFVLIDFYILSISKRKIISNSTFSWWASECGSSNDLIFQPEPFFIHIPSWKPKSLRKRISIKLERLLYDDKSNA